MSKTKAVFPKELLNNFIEEHNQNWINEYIENTKFDKGYYQALENFFKFKRYEKKPFNLFTNYDVSEYIETMIDNKFGTNKINSIISNINSFKKFLIEQHSDIFSEHLLNDLLELKMDIPEKKYIKNQPLNLVQLNYTKEFIKQDIRAEYIFEIFYQLKIQKQDIEICSPKYANKENMTFKRKNKTINYNNKIQELLIKIEKFSDFKDSYSIPMVNYYLDKIEQYLRIKGLYNVDKKLNYLDIAKTHEAFFIKCPNCGNEFESVSTNWALAKVDFGDNLFLVCSKCKGEPHNEYY